MNPRCLKGLAGNGDGVVDIFFCGFVDFADGLLGGWVDGLEGLAILAFDELVVDEAAITRVSIYAVWWGRQDIVG